MAMNQCCNCDTWYNETRSNPGCLCPDCHKIEIEEEHMVIQNTVEVTCLDCKQKIPPGTWIHFLRMGCKHIDCQIKEEEKSE